LALTAVAASLTLCVALPCRASVFSVVVNETSRAREEKEKSAGRFDVFGDLRDCDLGARLDNFAIHLMNERVTKGHIIVYSGRYDLPRRVLNYKDHMGDYLVNSRGLAPSRLAVVDGGYREELTIELWVVPKGAALPEPTETIDVNKELDKAYKFEEQYVSIPLELNAEVEEFELTEEVVDETAAGEVSAGEQPVEEQTDASAVDTSAQGEEAQAASATSQEEATGSDEDVWWILKTYAGALHKEEKARGHIIFYADREEATFSKVQAIVEQAMGQLAGKYGVKAERLTMVFGGYRESPTAELWLVPVNVSLPVPTPEPEKNEQDDELKGQAHAQPTAP
jgi:hypothetical protein